VGAAVHSLVRHFRGVQDHSDRGRRVLSGLSRRDGRGDVGRSQDRRGRPRLSLVRPRHGAAHLAAGGDAGLGFLLIDGQQLGKPAQIVAAIVAFAILGKATDWLLVLVSSPFLRWEDRFART